MSYNVKLPAFEGPMDLLLHLIGKNEIDIYNIPIAIITQQYMDYLKIAGEFDLDITSDFLVMACTLLSIKARMLLPKKLVEIDMEEENDPRQELVERILEYKEYKERAGTFKEMELQQAKCFSRETNDLQLLKKFPPANPIGSLVVEDLIVTFNNILKKMEKRNLTVSLSREEITIQNKIDYIYFSLMDKPNGTSFLKLFSDKADKDEIIVTFLALLELIRRGIIIFEQNCLFEDIYIFLNQITEGDKENAYSFS